MNEGQVPDWAAWIVLVLTLTGAGFSLIGAIGLVRLRTFYERVHAPTLGASLGTVFILAGSMLLLSLVEGRLVLRDLLVGLFITVTTPVTLIMLARAAAYRDRQAQDPKAPPEP